MYTKDKSSAVSQVSWFDLNKTRTLVTPCDVTGYHETTRQTPSSLSLYTVWFSLWCEWRYLLLCLIANVAIRFLATNGSFCSGLLCSSCDMVCFTQSIMEYNGGSVVAMVGKNCVAIASDMRLGNQALNVATFDKVFHLRQLLPLLKCSLWLKIGRYSLSQTVYILVSQVWQQMYQLCAYKHASPCVFF